MSPEIIFYSGIVLCAVAALGAAVGAIVLRLYKKRLQKQLDADYGKRRH